MQRVAVSLRFAFKSALCLMCFCVCGRPGRRLGQQLLGATAWRPTAQLPSVYRIYHHRDPSLLLSSFSLISCLRQPHLLLCSQLASGANSLHLPGDALHGEMPQAKRSLTFSLNSYSVACARFLALCRVSLPT